MEDALTDPDAVAFTQVVSSRSSRDKPLGTDGEAEVASSDAEVGDEPEGDIQRESMYVRMFNEMLETVLKDERFLFIQEELDYFELYQKLPYPARYLLVRLILRKPEKWYRSDALKNAYGRDIPKLNPAIDELSCKEELLTRKNVRKPLTIKADKREYIVIHDSDDEEDKPRSSGLPASPFFLQDDAHASLEDMLGCLIIPELKALAKDMKMKVADMKRAEIIHALIQHAEKQKTFSFFKVAENQTSRLRALVKKTTGRCIRLNSAIRQLFLRLNLVFFRSTTLTATLLPLILSNTRADNPSHRNYPKYVPTRTNTIFRSRESLITYERALEQEKQIEDALAQPSRVEGAWQAIATLRLAIHRWEELLDELDKKAVAAPGDPSRVGALERFEEGHVLTRVVYKGAAAYSIVKSHREEEEILRSLLYQDKWRQGRRGSWYDRLALLCMIYKDKSRKDFEEAWKIVKSGLDDPHTHLIYRPALEKRLLRLEKKLKIPEEERYQSDLYLRKAKHLLIKGRRIVPLPLSESSSTPRRSMSVASARPGLKKSATVPTTVRRSIASFCQSPAAAGRTGSRQPSVATSRKGDKENEESATRRVTGKSIWKGRDGEVNVEQLALEHYENLGFKGFHSEGRILLHIFTLLFWPVLFDFTIPGAFETSFQTGPLDLVHDTFYSSRKEAIEERLRLIEEGHAEAFIIEADERERPLKTWAAGVRWDDFSLEDVLGIAEGIGGEGLSVMCRLLCEDYANRGSGVPDLVVWKVEDKVCKFVEVKGPGDQLRENQRVWIDVIVRADIGVEVCRVEDLDYKSAKSPRKKSQAPAADVDVESEDDEEEDYDNIDPCNNATGGTDVEANASTRSRKRPHSNLEEVEPPAPASPSRRKTT